MTFLTGVNEVFDGPSRHGAQGTGQSTIRISNIESRAVAKGAALIYFED